MDYHTFRIVKDSDLGNSGYRLSQLDYNEYINSVSDQEDEIKSTTLDGALTDSATTITVARVQQILILQALCSLAMKK